MYSFIVKKLGKSDLSVTGTYMQIVKDACANVGDVESVAMGEKPNDKHSYIVTDTFQCALSYFVKGYKNHIVWLQGVVPEESYMRNHSKIRLFILSMMEKYVLKRAKLVLLVSESMRTHYEKKYKLDLSKKSVIMPCFNETAIVNDAFYDEKYKHNTFVYVGTLHKWQCFEQTVKLYSKIENASNGQTKFFVYTFQKDEAEKILKQNNIKNYIVDCVDKDVLSERIKGIKYGFVLREDHIVNNVATPTKFSNYLANGIIPIYSSAIESFSKFDNLNDVGLICNFDNINEGIEKILAHTQKEISSSEIRKKCENAFSTYYNANAYTAEISKKLKEIAK